MSAIFDSIINGTVTVQIYLLCLFVALICGLLTALAVSYRANVSKSFVISLIMLPMIVETVIIMVNGNIGTGVAVMGAFSLVRFRSVAGRAKDIAAIFLAMTAGLACAGGIYCDCTAIHGAGLCCAGSACADTIRRESHDGAAYYRARVAALCPCV